MKQVKSVLLAAVLMAFSAVHAADVGKTEDVNANARHIKLGVAADGKAGIDVADKSLEGKTNPNGKAYANNKLVSFDKMQRTAKNPFVSNDIAGTDKNGVTVANLYRMSGGIWDSVILSKMPDHSQLGRLTFAKAGNEDVWFGNWSDVPAGAAVGAAGKNYTAFYSGKNATTNLPSSGKATYDVKGINQYTQLNGALMTGTLTADFGAKTLSGKISRTNFDVSINATIKADASFAGSATAKLAGKTQNGSSNGQFFGNQGAVVAGVADFGKNNAANTAFGGSKK